MENLTIGQIWTWIIAASGAIITLSKVVEIIARKTKPNKVMTTMVHDHEKRLAEQEKANAVIFRALYAQINHELSGNGNEILRKSRDEIQNYLTNK